MLDHIDRHLDQDLSLDRLAAVAHFSRFHFHRVFAAIMGETINGYVRRQRLERVGHMLLCNPYVSVTELGLGCGFSSSAVLSRQFKQYFGCSPTVWRRGGFLEYRPGGPKDSKIGQQLSNQEQADRLNNRDTPFVFAEKSHKRSSQMNNVVIKNFSPVRVAYMRQIGPYGPQLQELWKKLVTWAKARDLLLDQTLSFGISHDDPRMTVPAKCRYDACIEIAQDYQPDGQVNVSEIPGGKYAVYAFRGAVPEVQQAWQDMFAVWLPDSGFQPDDRPSFERYVGDGNEEQSSKVFSCDICVPVRPLS